VAAQKPSSIPYADYLALETTSGVRYEWLNGVVHAMAGGTPTHAKLAAAMIRELGAALVGRPCDVFSSDLKIRVLATRLATYPDAAVVCSKRELDPDDANAVVNPVLLVEVLSDATEAYDRGEKFAHYRRIPSLKEYVLVTQHEPRIEVYRRNERGAFELFEAGAGEELLLETTGAKLSVDAVYRDPLAG
jgi:Uma2 family endonuclease